ncbi:MAG: META domain-containing protein [Rhodobacter sp.]|nr:META domain-containing protein [Rhodobacter sp.]
MLRIPLILPLLLTACPKDESVSGFVDPETVFHLVEMNGDPATAGATIQFPQEGRVQGTGPCNGYSATQTVPYPWIRIEAIAVTRRVCRELDAENAFLAALQAMTLVEAKGAVLILSNEAGGQLVFRAP